jgi:hypothetical protein
LAARERLAAGLPLTVESTGGRKAVPRCRMVVLFAIEDSSSKISGMEKVRP